LRPKARYWVPLLIAPALACAQQLEQPATYFQPGDRVVYNWVRNGKASLVEEEWLPAEGDDLRAEQKVGAKRFAVVVAKKSLVIKQMMCVANGQACTFSPGMEFARFPLEVGKRWSTSYTIKGETFTAHVTQERTVERVAKIKVPAGEFETFKIAYTGRMRGAAYGIVPFSGTEEGAEWVTVIAGRLVFARVTYRNSLGDDATLELVSTRFR
jgi:hypothetical protein